jgi:hypothetical protein
MRLVPNMPFIIGACCTRLLILKRELIGGIIFDERFMPRMRRIVFLWKSEKLEI